MTCLIATNSLGLAIPWTLKEALEALGAGRPSALATVTRAAALILALALVQAVIRTASRVLLFNAGRNVEYRLRRDLFERLITRPLSFFQTNPVGDLMSRLTNDLGAVRMLFGPAMLNVANTAIVYATGIAMLVRINPKLTVFALLPLPLVVAFGRLSSRSLHRANRAVSDQLGDLSTQIQEDLAGIGVVRAYALEPRRARAFAAANEEYYRRSLALVRTRGALSPVYALVAATGTLIVLWLGGREVIAGRMTVGALVAFNYTLGYLSWPTIALGWVISMWQRGLAGWRRVEELLPAQRDAPLTPDAAARPRDSSVQVAGLRIDRGGRRVLHDVSVSLRPGQTLAIVGRTGSGKTTLADALLRFVEIPKGSVFLGGVDVSELAPEALRRHVAYAPQEAFLFSATIEENIAFGRPRDEGDALPDDRAAIRAAAEAAGLARDVALFPDGYDTLVGERGITLSGGQRQRVALARALYARAPILLLDDALSAVDAETERTILDNLAPLLAARTSILVSHRVAAVRAADEILVLDQGHVVERGRHDELVARGGVYAGLYREQLALGEPQASEAGR